MSILPDGRRSADGRREMADFVSGNESSDCTPFTAPPKNRCEKCRPHRILQIAGHTCCFEEEVLVARQVLPLLLLVLGPLAVVGRALGADQVAVPIAERARGAERVVAGRVSSVTPEWQTSDYGDRLWHDGSRILDADIVFWDGAFKFFAGSSGCSGGFYIEDIAAHEFGHALGLGHSTSPTATMYPSAFTCDSSIRSLDADDISGVRALYPPGPPPPPPTGFRIVR